MLCSSVLRNSNTAAIPHNSAGGSLSQENLPMLSTIVMLAIRVHSDLDGIKPTKCYRKCLYFDKYERC